MEKVRFEVRIGEVKPEEEKVIITERGWAGHFILSHNCDFRRNTLIECGDKRIVVSTVGAYYNNGKYEKIGYERYFETKAFWAIYDGTYWDADVNKEIMFESGWTLDNIDYTSDKKANEMHDTVVEELKNRLLKG